MCQFENVVCCRRVSVGVEVIGGVRIMTDARFVPGSWYENCNDGLVGRGVGGHSL